MNSTNRAVLIRSYGGAEVTHAPTPEAGSGQVLVRVHAAGVNGIDWKVREGYVRDAFPLELPAVLGIELAGVVEAVGPDASRFQIGDRVMGRRAAWVPTQTKWSFPKRTWSVRRTA